MNWYYVLLGLIILALSGFVNSVQQSRLSEGKCAIEAVHYGQTENRLEVVCP